MRTLLELVPLMTGNSIYYTINFDTKYLKNIILRKYYIFEYSFFMPNIFIYFHWNLEVNVHATFAIYLHSKAF